MFQQAIQTLVVGIDFSDYSKLVVRQAKYLAKKWQTQIVLVYAMSEPITYEPTLYAAYANFYDPEHFKRRIYKTYSVTSQEVTVVCEHDVPSALLARVAAKFAQPLIMVGSVGMSGFTRLIFGSTAQNLALQSKCPVWIHRGDRIINPLRVMIPHDLTSQSNRSLDLLQKLSLLQPSTAEIFYVKDQVFPVLDYKEYMKRKNQVEQATTDKISQVLKNYKSIPLVTREGGVPDKVLRRTRKFDLVVMTHHHSTGLFSKSMTVELLKKIKTPMLIVPSNED